MGGFSVNLALKAKFLVFERQTLNYVAQFGYDLLLCCPLLNYYKNSIITGYCTENFLDMSVVDVVGYGAGIARSGAYDTHVAGEVDGEKPRQAHHFGRRAR